MGIVPENVVKTLAEIGNNMFSPAERGEMIRDFQNDARRNNLSMKEYLRAAQRENNNRDTLIICCVVADYMNFQLEIDKYPSIE